MVATIVFQTPPARFLSGNGLPPDELAHIESLLASEEAILRSEGFAHRLAQRLEDSAAHARLGADPLATLRRAIHTRRVRDSRIIEVGVSLDDREGDSIACAALLEVFLEQRLREGRPGTAEILDRCHLAVAGTGRP